MADDKTKNKNKGTAQQNNLLQAMLSGNAQHEVKSKNDTAYEKWLAEYRTINNRLNYAAKDSTSKNAMQEELRKHMAKLSDPNSGITHDGLMQYLAYTNQADEYRDLMLNNNKPTEKTPVQKYTHSSSIETSTNVYMPTGSIQGLSEKQIIAISNPQEVYKLSVEIAKQLNTLAPGSITTDVIGYETNAVNGEKTPIYGYKYTHHLATSGKLQYLAMLLYAANQQLATLLNKEHKAETKNMQDIGADKISQYSGGMQSTSYYKPDQIANNLIAAQYKAWYLVNKYNSDAAMYAAPEGYDFSKDKSEMAQRIIKERTDAEQAVAVADNMLSNAESLNLSKEDKDRLYYTYYDSMLKYFGKYMTEENRVIVEREKAKYTNRTTEGMISGQNSIPEKKANEILYGKGEK